MNREGIITQTLTDLFGEEPERAREMALMVIKQLDMSLPAEERMFPIKGAPEGLGHPGWHSVSSRTNRKRDT